MRESKINKKALQRLFFVLHIDAVFALLRALAD
jgi:hypothetical protein